MYCCRAEDKEVAVGWEKESCVGRKVWFGGTRRLCFCDDEKQEDLIMGILAFFIFPFDLIQTAYESLEKA